MHDLSGPWIIYFSIKTSGSKSRKGFHVHTKGLWARRQEVRNEFSAGKEEITNKESSIHKPFGDVRKIKSFGTKWP